jgi:hypothetical protein
MDTDEYRFSGPDGPGKGHPFPKFLSLRSLCSLWLA